MADASMNWDARQSRWRRTYKKVPLQITASNLVILFGLGDVEPNRTNTVVAANRWFRQEKERIDREKIVTTYRPNELDYIAEREKIESLIKFFSVLIRNPNHQSVIPVVASLKHRKSLIEQELRKPVLSPINDRFRNPLDLSPDTIEKEATEEAKHQIANDLREEDITWVSDEEIDHTFEEEYIFDGDTMIRWRGSAYSPELVERTIENRIQAEAEARVNFPVELIKRKREEAGAIDELTRGKISQMLQDAGATLPDNQHLSYHIDRFLEAQQRRCAEGQIKVGRLEKIRNTIKTYQEWTQIVRVSKIGTKDHIDDYRRFLSDKVIAEVWKPKYANDLFSGLKMLIQWLFDEEVLPEYPACLQRKGNKYSFTVPLPTPQTIPLEWVHKLLDAANPRLKLYILLALNCGFVESDIGQLTAEKYDPKSGRITYKRKKTEKYKNVPTVCYKLWSETKEFLDNEIAANKKKHPKSTKFLLINENGSPLWTEYIDENGKAHKSDNIVSAFKRLVAKLRKDEPDMPPISFKLFRKTSSSLIRNEKEYAMYAWLFLGHSPQTTGDKFYNALDDTILDDTIDWLHDKIYGFLVPAEAENVKMGKVRQ